MRDPGLPFTWALIIGCALSHAAPGDEQPAPAQLGKVVDDAGRPVAGARVRLNTVSFEKGVEEQGPFVANVAGGFRLPLPFRSSGQFRCYLFAENDDGQMGWLKSAFPRPFPLNGPAQIVLKPARETTVNVTDADADSVFALKGGVGFANQWFPPDADQQAGLPSPVLTHKRRTSATLHACATHPRG
jgi:hypothetical protein